MDFFPYIKTVYRNASKFDLSASGFCLTKKDIRLTVLFLIHCSLYCGCQKARGFSGISNNLHKESKKKNLSGRPSEALLNSINFSCLRILLGLSFNSHNAKHYN